MKHQYVVIQITHTNFFIPFAMSWQLCGNVVATVGCQQVTSNISASVNGAYLT